MTDNTQYDIQEILENYFSTNQQTSFLTNVQAILPFRLAVNQNKNNKKPINNSTVSEKLSKTVEFSSGRKRKGAYYTPVDVVNYTVYNVIHNSLTNSSEVLPVSAIKKQCYDKNKLLHLCTQETFLDPTCGAGSFLLSILEAKLFFLKAIKQDNLANVLKVIQTIFGNDIDTNAVLVSKLRILFYLQEHHYQINSQIIQAINNNFSTYNFIFDAMPNNCKYNFIIGNPPYIEYRSLDEKPKTKYGNVYADVLHNTNNHLKPNSSIAYIVPISFSSTPRMKNIRNEELSSFSNNIVLSFADRPDSLFSSVHQKINIIFGLNFNSNRTHNLYTSQYNCWYKDERQQLFERLSVVKNDDYNDFAIPKYGNTLQKNIYKKVTNTSNAPLLDLLTKNQTPSNNSIYLAKRNFTYIKCFLNNPKSNEYDCYDVVQLPAKTMLAILSSTLFWMYWTIYSDGWHLTNKELSTFTIPIIDNKTNKQLINLADKLLQRLEETKVYVGTVQTDYEYKHKEALDILDKIDDVLGIVYQLTPKEIHYIQNYARKYRGGSVQ